MERFRQACRLLPPGLRAAAMCCPEGGAVEELRLRGGQPLWLSGPWGEKQNGGPNVTPQDLEAVIDAATGHSRYLAEETLRQG